MTDAQPLLVVDITTAFEERGRAAHGTVRVERGIIHALANLGREDIAFCRRRPVTGGLLPVSRAEAIRIVSATTLPERRRKSRSSLSLSRVFAPGKTVERWVRINLRNRLWRSYVAGPLAVARPEGVGLRGSVLLFPVECRHEFAQLMRLKRSHGLSLAFVFFDLLDVLPAGHPKLRDKATSDLPATNFFLREADVLLAQSRFSAGLLEQYAQDVGIATPPLQVIRLGSTLSGPSAKQVAGFEPGRYVLMVGGISERKNQELLFEVWPRLIKAGVAVIPLVLVGSIGRDGTAIVAKAHSDPTLAPWVHFLPNAGDGELAWLYANCRFTVFPSRAEGFGMPPAEGMLYGKTCISSSAGGLPESTQGVAVLLDPADAPGWAETVGRLISDDRELARLEADVRQRFRPITWADTADDILAGIASYTRLRAPASSQGEGDPAGARCSEPDTP